MVSWERFPTAIILRSAMEPETLACRVEGVTLYFQPLSYADQSSVHCPLNLVGIRQCPAASELWLGIVVRRQCEQQFFRSAGFSVMNATPIPCRNNNAYALCVYIGPLRH